MKKKYLSKAILILLPLIFLSFYKLNSDQFHTSITKVEYIQGNKTLKLSTKINTLDIEKILGVKASTNTFGSSLSKYLQQNVKISVNDVPVSFNFSSYNPDGNVIWVYYEATNLEGLINSITIKNSILINNFPDQQNFISFLVNGKRKSLVCKKGSETGRVNF
ncbi:hypothetical protein ETU08_05265 [Apibacter muscae]|uniref:M penetrans family 1 protein n=1 Tax=Apibacter muscae TaxID=2509004 RepID=A0A563DER0_9FLAO|nr:DUF6702 family protein [Apibacter muscae]TWP28778.1 hypothetical protein ETU09_05540 [Apibacter muscae]TWP29970.1 hypothetical protein ETU08_05265 [Apibacter muscae]